MVATFCIGLLSGLFGYNFLRVIFNFCLAQTVNKNPSSCLRFFVSKEAVTVVKEMQLVAEAEKHINKQLNFEIDNNTSLRKSDSSHLGSSKNKIEPMSDASCNDLGVSA